MPRGYSDASAEPGKFATDQNLTIRLQDQNGDNPVRAGIEARIQRSVWIQACDPVPSPTSKKRKIAADENLPVRLHREAEDAAVCSGIERHIERAVVMQASDPLACRRPAAAAAKSGEPAAE
jgi:hypothetical protein